MTSQFRCQICIHKASQSSALTERRYRSSYLGVGSIPIHAIREKTFPSSVFIRVHLWLKRSLRNFHFRERAFGVALARHSSLPGGEGDKLKLAAARFPLLANHFIRAIAR